MPGESVVGRVWTVDAQVLLVAPEPPLACMMMLQSLPPAGGSGVEVLGIDPAEVPGAEIFANGTVITPRLRLTGVYDGRRLVLTAPPVPAPARDAVEDVRLPGTACPEPGDGAFHRDERQAAISYANGQPDLGEVWMSDDQRVLNVSFTGDLDRHERALRALYPGPLCVVEASASAEELRATQRRLHADPELPARHIHALQSFPMGGRLHVLAVAAGPAEVEFLQERYGPALEVESWLSPVDEPPTAGVRVRAATLDDVPAMSRTFVDTFRTAHRYQMPEELLLERTYESSAAGWERALGEIAESEDPEDHVCVAEDATGAIVGLAMCGPPRDWPFDDANRAAHPTGECYLLYVDPNRQGSGIGRALLADLAAFLVSRGRRRLQIGVLTVNHPARAFYERVGGTLLGERPFDDSGVLLDTVVYVWDDATVLTAARA